MKRGIPTVAGAGLLCARLACGQGVPLDFDAAYRAPVEAVVIHHTGTPSSFDVARLSGIQKEAVYAPVFKAMAGTIGPRIYSNHLFAGSETFCCYHWLVYPDGKSVQVLKDVRKVGGTWYVDQVGWHAGTWEWNGRSVAVAFVGNYRSAAPPKAALESAAAIIADLERKTGRTLAISGHREVRPTPTSCPGNTFLGPSGWKRTLAAAIAPRR